MSKTESESKRCASCKVIKPLVDFSRDKGRKDGLNPYCRPCAKAKHAQSLARRRVVPCSRAGCERPRKDVASGLVTSPVVVGFRP